MRIPAPILEHPIESLVAGVLLLGLLLGSADYQSGKTAGTPAAAAPAGTQMLPGGKM